MLIYFVERRENRARHATPAVLELRKGPACSHGGPGADDGDRALPGRDFGRAQRHPLLLSALCAVRSVAGDSLLEHSAGQYVRAIGRR